MIKIRELGKRFGTLDVLKGIDLDIKKGEIYGLVGSSGAGKSTLLRCINGLAGYDSGSLQVDGVEIGELKEKELREFRRSIGMIFQQFSLLERLSVYDNVALPMTCWKYEKTEIDIRVKELLELVGLTEKIKSKPAELSGGQKQRVAIARALTMNPKVLLCDEATSALDPNISKSVLRLLDKINRELGITIVVVAHQMDVIKQICHRMALLNHGIIVEKGAVDDIFIDNSKELQALLGEQSFDALPKTGTNLKIVLRESSERVKLLSVMAIDTGIPYTYVWGGYSYFRGELIGTLILNIDTKEQVETITKYLASKNIKWKEVTENEQ